MIFQVFLLQPVFTTQDKITEELRLENEALQGIIAKLRFDITYLKSLLDNKLEKQTITNILPFFH